MRSAILSKPALIMAAGAALAGLCAVAGTASAATRTVATPHRGTAASASTQPQATGFVNWPMFRGNLTHTGVSPETAINTTNASTLTAGWTASVASAAYSSPAVVNIKGTGPTVFVGGAGIFAAYSATTGAQLWTFPVNKIVNSSPTVFDGVVYFASSDGTIYAVNATNGTLVCSYDTNQQADGVTQSFCEGGLLGHWVPGPC